MKPPSIQGASGAMPPSGGGDDPRIEEVKRRFTALYSQRWPLASTGLIYWQLDWSSLRVTETASLPSRLEVEGTEYAKGTDAPLRRVLFTGGFNPTTLHTWLDVRTPTGIAGSETGNKIQLARMQRQQANDQTSPRADAAQGAKGSGRVIDLWAATQARAQVVVERTLRSPSGSGRLSVTDVRTLKKAESFDDQLLRDAAATGVALGVARQARHNFTSALEGLGLGERVRERLHVTFTGAAGDLRNMALTIAGEQVTVAFPLVVGDAARGRAELAEALERFVIEHHAAFSV